MSSPEEQTNDSGISPIADVQERVRQFNEDEAVWRSFVRRRARRLHVMRLLRSRSFAEPHPLTEEQLNRLDWLAAEREARPVRAIGKWVAP